MINNDYLVDMSYMDDSGSYCDFLPIRGEDHLGFKSFKLKSKAKETYEIQKKLSKFNLDGYYFSKSESSATEPVFLRD